MTTLAPLGQRAIVAGGSLAGLLTARVLADHFAQVVVLDRDKIQDAPEYRAMTPHTRHAHVLLKGGEIAIERLLPGFTEDMKRLGSVAMNPGRDMRLGNDLGFAPSWDAPFLILGQSRATLEHYVRQRVRDYSSHIQLLDQTTVRGVLASPDGQRITRVTFEGSTGATEELSADLVVDATGRGAGAMRWLAALELATPVVETVKVDFGYSSCQFRLRTDTDRDWQGCIVGALPPNARGGIILPTGDGAHVCSLGGRFGDFPPEDLSGFIAYAATLSQPTLYEAIRDAEPVSDVYTIRYLENRFRRYDRMPNLTPGILPIGDALCSVNPTYGQGMSSASRQVAALADVLAERSPDASLGSVITHHLERAAAIADAPWRQANFTDLAYPATEGDRSMFTSEEAEARMKVQMLANQDPEIRLQQLKVNHMIESPETLFADEHVVAKLAAMN